ncbi:MAG: hypothetical protein ACRCX2_14895 [Paraclostridium sp.]
MITSKMFSDVVNIGKYGNYGHRNMMNKIKDLINNLNKIGVYRINIYINTK